MFLLLIHYFTLWPWPLTLWCWTFPVYRWWCDKTLCQIWKQSSNSPRRYSDFNIWPYDLEHCVTCCARLWDNFFTTFDHRQLIRAWIVAFFGADTLFHAVTLTFDQSLKVSGTSSVAWSKSVRNLSEIEQSAAELLIILRYLHTLSHGVTSTFDLLTLNFYSTSGVTRLNSVQNLSEIE